MKLFVLAVLVAAVLFELVASDSPPATPECAVGESKEVDCNSCMCTNGKWACTRKSCPHEVEKRDTATDECSTGDTKMEDCNSCRCISGNWACTKIRCPTKNRDKREIIREKCEPNTVIRQGCNVCRCGEDGEVAYCHLSRCPQSNPGENRWVGNRHVALRDVSGQTCTPGTTYQNDCNTCTCPSDGQTAHAACTLKACL